VVSTVALLISVPLSISLWLAAIVWPPAKSHDAPASITMLAKSRYFEPIPASVPITSALVPVVSSSVLTVAEPIVLPPTTTPENTAPAPITIRFV